MSGEKMLMLAVLEDAIRVLLRGPNMRLSTERLLFNQTESWFFRKRDGYDIFSFENITEALDINPAYLRKNMRGLMNELHRKNIPNGKGRRKNRSR